MKYTDISSPLKAELPPLLCELSRLTVGACPMSNGGRSATEYRVVGQQKRPVTASLDNKDYTPTSCIPQPNFVGKLPRLSTKCTPSPSGKTSRNVSPSTVRTPDTSGSTVSTNTRQSSSFTHDLIAAITSLTSCNCVASFTCDASDILFLRQWSNGFKALRI